MSHAEAKRPFARRPTPRPRREDHQRQGHEQFHESLLVPAEHPRQSREARCIRHAAGGRERAAAIREPLAGVRLDAPLRQQHGSGDDGHGGGDATRHLGTRCEFQIKSLYCVRVGALRQRNEIRVAVLHGHHRRAVHRHRPERGVGGQREFEMRIATILHEVFRVGHHFAVLRDARVERRAIHDEAERLALLQRAERKLQVERSRRVAIGLENRRIEEEPVFRGHLGGFELKQSSGHIRRLHLELIRADHERVALLALRIERTRAGERERVALRLERPLVGHQQRVRPGHRRVQRDEIAVRRLLPVVAEILAGELDVEILVRQRDEEGGHWRAGDEEVHRAAAVGDALANGEQVEDVGLNRLGQSLDAHRRLPRRLGQAKRRLDARDLAREERRRDVRERDRAIRRETEARVRRHREVTARGFRLHHFDTRQHPRRLAERSVAFKAELNHLPVGDGLAVNQPQLGIRLVGWFAEKIIAKPRRRETRQHKSPGHAQQHLAHRCLADVQLELAVDGQLRLAEMIGEQLRHAHLGQHVVGIHAQRKLGARKAEGKTLVAHRREHRFQRGAFGELLG